MRTKQELDAAIRRERRAALVVNAHSRRGRRLYDARPGAAGRGRLQPARQRIRSTGPPSWSSASPRRPGRDPDLLIAGGGDGTISAAARLLAHRDMALGLLPLGTTNNFARTLGIPLDLDAAVAMLTDGKVIDVDLGLAGDLPFANHVGIGLSADVMLKAPPRLKRAAGRLAYPITALALLTRHRPLRATVRDRPASEHTYVTHQLYVANGGFHAGRPITADTDADDQLLVAYPVGEAARRDLLRQTARNAATGHRRTLGDEPFLAVGGELWLETDRPARVEVDGELRGHTPLRIGLDANALRVMARADSPDR